MTRICEHAHLRHELCDNRFSQKLKLRRQSPIQRIFATLLSFFFSSFFYGLLNLTFRGIFLGKRK